MRLYSGITFPTDNPWRLGAASDAAVSNRENWVVAYQVP